MKKIKPKEHKMTEAQLEQATAEMIQKISIVCEKACTMQGLIDGHAPMPEVELDQAYVAAVRAFVLVEQGLVRTKEEIDTILAEILSAAVLLHKHCVEHRVGAFAKVLGAEEKQ